MLEGKLKQNQNNPLDENWLHECSQFVSQHQWIASHIHIIELTNENTTINCNYLVFEDNLCYFDEIHRREGANEEQTEDNNKKRIHLA